MAPSSRRAAFLDRDGVLNELVWDPSDRRAESPLRVQDVRLLPGAAGGIRALRDAGFVVVVVSNQPAVAKGKATSGQLDAVHRRVEKLLSEAGAHVDNWQYCRHLAEDGCPCRKPRPGLLFAAADALRIDLRRSWIIGDTDADVGAGRAAGTRTVLVEHAGSAHKRTGGVQADAVASDLTAAVAHVLGAADRGSVVEQ
jgi:D-glycero-D-manno-heptose 1,7-bisphosphate phosphatase